MTIALASFHDFWRYGPLGKKFSDERVRAGSIVFTTLVINLLSLALPILLLQIYDRIIPNQSFGTLAMLVGGVMAALVMEGVLRYCTAYITTWMGASFEHRATLRALEQMSRADVQLLEMEGTATYLQRLSAIMKLRECYSGRSLSAVIDLPFSLLYLGIIYYLGNWLVLAPIAVAALFVTMALRLGGRLRANLDYHASADEDKYNFIIDVLGGIHTVKALGMEMQMLRRFEHLQREATHSAHNVGLFSSYNVILMEVFSSAAMAVTVILGSLIVMKGQLSVGGLAACTLLVGRTMQPLQRALDSWGRFQDFLVAREHGQAILDLPSRHGEHTPPDVPPRGEIIMDDVTFYYAVAGDMPLFEHLNLHINPGDAVAITGAKGNGKTTLLQLMMGTFSPVQGQLTIDGLEPAGMEPGTMRPHIAYLPQKSVLFRGTVMENLTGFRSDQPTMDKARQAAAELGIDHIINSLPQGYNTYLGDGISDPIAPGVKQRVCLARALAQEAKILLFDDADRALDAEGFRFVLEALWRRRGACTLVIASEHEHLIDICDRVLNLTADKFIPVPKRR